MQERLIIIGAGMLAREVYSWAYDAIAAGAPWTIVGFLDDRSSMLDNYNYDVPVLTSVESYMPVSDDVFLCGIGDPHEKRKYCEIILTKGGRFATLVHPTAVVGRNVRLGDGVIIAPLAVITADVSIGNCVFIGCHTICSHDNLISDWAHICGHTGLAGNVIVEDMVFIGAGVTIVPNTRISSGAYVGAGSVVLKRVRAGTKVFGNPAVVIDV